MYPFKKGLVNLNTIKQFHVTEPNEDGYCAILGFDELVDDPDSAELPNHIVLHSCLEDDVPAFLQHITDITTNQIPVD